MSDFGLLSPVTASPAVAALTGDRAVLSAILDVEAAWSAVLEEAGLAPEGSRRPRTRNTTIPRPSPNAPWAAAIR
jgi:hypothetical protein